MNPPTGWHKTGPLCVAGHNRVAMPDVNERVSS